MGRDFQLQMQRVLAAVAIALSAASCSKTPSIAVCGPGIEIADAMPGASAIASVDGRNVRLDNGATFELPEASAGLSVAELRALFPHGAEIGSDGVAYALLNIWHNCGNDAIRKHNERVRVDALLSYLESNRATFGLTRPGYSELVSAHGLLVGIFTEFAAATGTPWNYTGNWPMWDPPG